MPQGHGRLGADDDAGEMVAGDVVEIASQGIAAGPQLARGPLTLLALEQLLLPFKELGLVAQRLVESLTPQHVLRRHYREQVALQQVSQQEDDDGNRPALAGVHLPDEEDQVQGDDVGEQRDLPARDAVTHEVPDDDHDRKGSEP